MTFVGQKIVNSAAELQNLLESLSTENRYFCFRWPHKISNFESQISENFPSPAGQMIDSQREIRWKQKGHQEFDILLLSTSESDNRFAPIGDRWYVETRDVFSYQSEETRFPKEIDRTPPKLKQNYFRDSQTSTIHFVALTVSV